MTLSDAPALKRREIVLGVEINVSVVGVNDELSGTKQLLRDLTNGLATDRRGTAEQAELTAQHFW